MTITLGDGMYHCYDLCNLVLGLSILLVNKFARGNNGAIYPAELSSRVFFILIELDQLVSVLYSDKCVIESIFLF
jgi:hypothetical protein